MLPAGGKVTVGRKQKKKTKGSVSLTVSTTLNGGVKRGLGVVNKKRKERTDGQLQPRVVISKSNTVPEPDGKDSPRRDRSDYRSGAGVASKSMLEWCAAKSGVYSGRRTPQVPAIPWKASNERGMSTSPRYNGASKSYFAPDRSPTGTPVFPSNLDEEELNNEVTSGRFSSDKSPSRINGFHSNTVQDVSTFNNTSADGNTTRQSKWNYPAEGQAWEDQLPTVGTPSLSCVSHSPRRSTSTISRRKLIESSIGHSHSSSGSPDRECVSVPYRFQPEEGCPTPQPPPNLVLHQERTHEKSSHIPIPNHSEYRKKSGGTQTETSLIRDPGDGFNYHSNVPSAMTDEDNSASASRTFDVSSVSYNQENINNYPKSPYANSRSPSTGKRPLLSPLAPMQPTGYYSTGTMSPPPPVFRQLPYLTNGSPNLHQLVDLPPDHWWNTYNKLRHRHTGDDDGDMEECSTISSDNDGLLVIGRRSPRTHDNSNEASPTLAQLLLADGKNQREKKKKATPHRSRKITLSKSPSKSPTLNKNDVRLRQLTYSLAERESRGRRDIDDEERSAFSSISHSISREDAKKSAPQKLVETLLSQCECKNEVIHVLISMGNAEGIGFLLSQNKGTAFYDIEYKSVNGDGSTPLVSAVRSGNLSITKIIVNQGNGNVNGEGNSVGWTALHYAASQASQGLISLLLGALPVESKRGCVNRLDKDHSNPLHVLLRVPNPKSVSEFRSCVSLLLASGVDITAESFGQSCAELLSLRESTLDILAGISNQNVQHLKYLVRSNKGNVEALQQLIDVSKNTSSSVVRMTLGIPFENFDQNWLSEVVTDSYNKTESGTTLTAENVVVLSIVRGPTCVRFQVVGLADSEAVIFSLVRSCKDASSELCEKLCLREIVIEKDEEPVEEEVLPKSPSSVQVVATRFVSTPETPMIAMSPASEAVPLSLLLQDSRRSDTTIDNQNSYLSDLPDPLINEVSSKSVADAVVSRFDTIGDGCLNMKEWNNMLCSLGSISVSENDYSTLCRTRRVNPRKGLDSVVIADIITSNIEESLRELLCVPPLSQRIVIQNMRVRHILNGKQGIVSGYRPDGVALIDLKNYPGTPISLRNLTWDGKRDWLTPPPYSVIEEAVRIPVLIKLKSYFKQQNKNDEKWVQIIKPLEEAQDKATSQPYGTNGHKHWRVLRVCGRKVSTIKAIEEIISKVASGQSSISSNSKSGIRIILTPPPTVSYGQVVIHGLKQFRHLNGSKGSVKSIRDKGRVALVKIHDVSTATPIHAQCCIPVIPTESDKPGTPVWTPRVGMKVKVTGLRIHSELNDQIGTIVNVRSSDNVAFVNLPGVDSAPLRPNNMTPVPDDYTPPSVSPISRTPPLSDELSASLSNSRVTSANGGSGTPEPHESFSETQTPLQAIHSVHFSSESGEL